MDFVGKHGILVWQDVIFHSIILPWLQFLYRKRLLSYLKQLWWLHWRAEIHHWTFILLLHYSQCKKQLFFLLCRTFWCNFKIKINIFFLAKKIVLIWDACLTNYLYKVKPCLWYLYEEVSRKYFLCKMEFFFFLSHLLWISCVEFLYIRFLRALTQDETTLLFHKSRFLSTEIKKSCL